MECHGEDSVLQDCILTRNAYMSLHSKRKCMLAPKFWQEAYRNSYALMDNMGKSLHSDLNMREMIISASLILLSCWVLLYFKKMITSLKNVNNCFLSWHKSQVWWGEWWPVPLNTRTPGTVHTLPHKVASRRKYVGLCRCVQGHHKGPLTSKTGKW